MGWLLLLGILGLAGAALAWWLLVTTEGVYLGQRVVIWLYDLYAGRYDAIKGFDPRSETLFLGLSTRIALKDVRAPLVLDVATGTGRYPLVLLEEPHFNGRVWGLELSRKMLSQAAAKLGDRGDRLAWLWYEAEHLPFEDHTFDMVACLEALEFLRSQRQALAEMVRVLRPGGVLLTTRRLGRDARLMPGRALSESALQALLESLGRESGAFRRWQMDYDLVWAHRPGAGKGGARPLLEVLRCPACEAVALKEKARALACQTCGARHPLAEDGVIELL